MYVSKSAEESGEYVAAPPPAAPVVIKELSALERKVIKIANHTADGALAVILLVSWIVIILSIIAFRKY